MAESSDTSDAISPDRDHCRVFLEITDALCRATNFPEAFKELAPPLLALTDGEFLNLSLRDPHRDFVLTQYWKKNHEAGELEPHPISEVGAGLPIDEPVNIPDIEQDRHFSNWAPVLMNHGVRSYAAIPIINASTCFGAVGLGKRSAAGLKRNDIDLLAHVARVGAVALEKERTEHVREEQRSLFAIGRELSCSLDLDILLPAILSNVRSIARYDRTVIALLDEDGKNVCLYGNSSGWGPLVNHAIVPVGQSLSGRAIQTRGVSIFSAEELSQINAPLAKAMCQQGMRSACSVPVMAGNRVWGALNVAVDIDNAFAPSEIEYLEQVATQIGILLQHAHSIREIVGLKKRLAKGNSVADHETHRPHGGDDIVGKSPALARVLDYAGIVADTDSTVLITGETGTGKERIARLIHGTSQRRGRSFIKLNCAAIPTGLLESELFGHEKGAFTGAVSQKIGRLELADQGTLLLDEIGEIPLELQPKLLRVLQDQEFERLGGTRTIRVNVRLIAATNRNLAQAVADKEFRADLFYRLHVFPLHMPALRDRREDIPTLASYFVEKCSARLNKRIDMIPEAVIEAMMRWSWPGNIRELENFVERSVILSEGNRLAAPLGELREVISRQRLDSDVTLHERERVHIVEILRQTRGALSGPGGAAARLGLKRTTLQYKMQRLGISRTDYLC